MALFEQKAPGIMRDLMRDLGLRDFQAAGVLGNIGVESNGFKTFQEMAPRGGAGGYGWAQWTGPRRRAFFAWIAEKGLHRDSDQANYGFLLHELGGPEKAALAALRRTTTLEDATICFEDKFERAGVKAHGTRIAYARRAMAAFRMLAPAPKYAPNPPPPDTEPAEPDDTKPHAAPKGEAKTGITQGAKAGAGLGLIGLLSSAWEALTSAPETILQIIAAAASKPSFWIFAAVIVAAGYVWWRRSNMKKAAAE